MAPMSADDGAPRELDTLHDVDAAATGGAASAFAVGGFAERYERGEPLGAGGMGVVQAWRDRATGREVAMKTIRASGAALRFAREARVQAQLVGALGLAWSARFRYKRGMDEAVLSIAPVTEADLAAIDAYLAARSDTCMFLRSNLRDAGLSWTPPHGAPLQAQYVVGRRASEVFGVAAHGWNGHVLIQADACPGELAEAAVRHSGRPVAGLVGPADVAQFKVDTEFRSKTECRLGDQCVLDVFSPHGR